MLNIYFGDMSDAIYNTKVFFDNAYEDEWLLDEFAKRLIKEIDKSEVIDAQMIKSPVLGVISPTALSGGTKTLLLIKNYTDKVFNASMCGDNCAKYILELARNRELTINLRHIMNFGKRKFEIRTLNDGRIAHDMTELLSIAAKYV